MFDEINILSIIGDYDFMVEDCYCKNIDCIYLWARSELQDKGFDDIEMSKKLFIDILEKFIKDGMVKLHFRVAIVGEQQQQQLDNADINTQLKFFYDTFPIEYDEKIIEKDIDNLWWCCCCPADAGWLLEDGTYWISG